MRFSVRRRVSGTSIAATVVMVATYAVLPAQAAEAAPVSVYLTTADGHHLLEPGERLDFGHDPDAIDLPVDAAGRHQSMLGVGASVTESSAHLISQLPKDKRETLMADLFGDKGIGLDYLRQPVASSDFVKSLPFYSYDDGDTPDPDLTRFAITRDEPEILPVLRQARATNGSVRVMASPWSPPAWMKDSGQLTDGRLKPEYYRAYADYLVKFIRAYAKAGITIGELTPQNEPLFGNPKYPSTRFSSTQEADFLRVLDRRLTAARLDTKIFAFDDNWQDWKYAVDVLRATSDIRRVVGAAFHCYKGDPESARHIGDLGGRVALTECSGAESRSPGTSFSSSLKWQTENLTIRALRSGSETLMGWNLALDAKGGPHDGYCLDRCRGVATIDGSTVSYNAQYYSLGHVSKFVARGARRVDSGTQGGGGVESVAFVNPDGTRALVVLNADDSAHTFTFGEHAERAEYALPAGAVATFTWPGSADRK
ncbi:MAG TPA: glycoside hydrolase family 30 beta sandwich domain-containing protein [Stackebrandtia sp.]|jgi:glucosylceramidase|uniref:glycoside hydrolase family 30 protein n=1 Tax=Stackebrandtia sp. TaxID=2023065 RepID=UPI002D57C244|nr:glycoside hydrolase family 30 beta sandwich domain-containing protein [Stackebrandtia sp.]HZE39025.1 glycoside hydrolase family 30 beta sandwich domain-containing protein [Stackebrandtia sp.]